MIVKYCDLCGRRLKDDEVLSPVSLSVADQNLLYNKKTFEICEYCCIDYNNQAKQFQSTFVETKLRTAKMNGGIKC